MSNKLLFLDTETTGTEDEDRICQVAYKYDDVVVNELFKPPLPIKIDAMAITHITNKMVEGKPSFIESEQYKELLRLNDDGYILVAHNAQYDLKMLEKEGILFDNYICTMKVAQELDTDAVIPSYGLQYLRYLLDLDVEATAHDAYGDILVLEKLFDRLIAKVNDDREVAISKMTEISSKPTLIKKFPFGKNKGQKVADVERSYLEWLLREKRANQPDDVDWIYTLEHHLYGRQS